MSDRSIRSPFRHFKLIAIFGALFLFITLAYLWLFGPAIDNVTTHWYPAALTDLLRIVGWGCAIWALGGLLLGILVQNRTHRFAPAMLAGLWLGLPGGLIATLLLEWNLDGYRVPFLQAPPAGAYTSSAQSFLLLWLALLLSTLLGCLIGTGFSALTPASHNKEE